MAIFGGLSRKSRGRLAAWIETKLQGQSLKSHGDGGVAPRPRPLPNECDTCDIMYNYIPHPSNMRTMDQVLAMRIAEGAAGYGIYMMLLELLRDAEGRSLVSNPAHLAFAINEQDVSLVERIIKDYGLFTLGDDGRFTSPWLEAAMDEYDAKKAAAREAGRRGAAKRYGKVAEPAPDMTKDENPKQVPYGDPIGGGMGSVETPHANITLPNKTKQNITNQIQSKSKLLSLSWGRWSGEELYLIARQKGTFLSPLDREEVAIRMAAELAKEVQEFNPELVFDIAQDMKFSHEQYEVLLDILDGGRVGTPRIREAIRIYNAWQSREFRANFPFEYLICKLLEL